MVADGGAFLDIEQPGNFNVDGGSNRYFFTDFRSE